MNFSHVVVNPLARGEIHRTHPTKVSAAPHARNVIAAFVSLDGGLAP
jgi:hypothetical protein